MVNVIISLAIFLFLQTYKIKTFPIITFLSLSNVLNSYEIFLFSLQMILIVIPEMVHPSIVEICNFYMLAHAKSFSFGFLLTQLLILFQERLVK